MVGNIQVVFSMIKLRYHSCFACRGNGIAEQIWRR